MAGPLQKVRNSDLTSTSCCYSRKRHGKNIVISDIHGCYDELTMLLGKARFSQDDKVVAVGDLTVKGPKSREVLNLFYSDSRFSSVVGNHDLALVRFWKGATSKLKASQESTFVELRNGSEHLLEYLSSLPSHIDLAAHVVVHAGLRPDIPLNQQSLDDRLN